MDSQNPKCPLKRLTAFPKSLGAAGLSWGHGLAKGKASGAGSKDQILTGTCQPGSQVCRGKQMVHTARSHCADTTQGHPLPEVPGVDSSPSWSAHPGTAVARPTRVTEEGVPTVTAMPSHGRPSSTQLPCPPLFPQQHTLPGLTTGAPCLGPHNHYALGLPPNHPGPQLASAPLPMGSCLPAAQPSLFSPTLCLCSPASLLPPVSPSSPHAAP